MKLPMPLSDFFQQKKEKKEVFLSLVIHVDSIQAAVWHPNERGVPKILASSIEPVDTDDWEERIDASDRAIVKIEDVGTDIPVQKTVLGLSSLYLTNEGDIEKDILPKIKILTEELNLEPVGYVALHQAIAHYFKKQEGVPPTVILIGITNKIFIISLYKIGKLMLHKVIQYGENPIETIEKTFKSVSDIEILPSRILLYGGKSVLLEQIKSELLNHPWQTRANFLHFPKIEILDPRWVVTAVSYAGGTEITEGIKRGSYQKEEVEDQKEYTKEETVSEKEVQEEVKLTKTDKKDKEKLEKEIKNKELIDKETAEEPNVILVDAEELGFKKDTASQELEEREKEKAKKHAVGFELPKHVISSIKEKIPRFHTPRIPKLQLTEPFTLTPSYTLLFAGVVIGILIIIWLFFWIMPRSQCTILATPKIIETIQAVTLDQTASNVGAEAKIIPARLQERTVSSETSIGVSGTKDVGDPARGVVTIYNKTLASKIFKKGIAVRSSNLQFTLDDDVQIASATESIGSMTFGKGKIGVTAGAIGSQSNMPANTEFTIGDSPISSFIARNEESFTGGTSREVSVVTRADQDELVNVLTAELVEKAKAELKGSITGGETLLDDTVKTTVKEKKFTEELGEEAAQLHGSITLSVSGISYKDGDLSSLLASTVHNKVPDGYTLQDEGAKVEVLESVIDKNGKITLKVNYKGSALPQFDTEKIRKELAGKSISEAQEYIKSIKGAGGVEFRFLWAVSKKKLPANNKNIKLEVSVRE